MLFVVAKASTLYRFAIELSDIDRGVYESLDLRVAAHPSEDAERLMIRVLARAVAHEPGLEFGRGLSHSEDPALWTRDAQGMVSTWIDVGCPSAERLHRASKASERVLVFSSKNDAMLKKEWTSQVIHGAEAIEVFRLPPEFVSTLSERLDRKMQWYVTLMDGSIGIADGEESLDAPLFRCSLADLVASW